MTSRDPNDRMNFSYGIDVAVGGDIVDEDKKRQTICKMFQKS